MHDEPTVFVVDDDPGVRTAIALLLKSVGLRVEGFASPQEFLATFDPNRSGCLVLDVRMPGMSGLDLQARLAAEAVHPPIIIITGHGDVPMAVQAVRTGALDFIEKPFRNQQLIDSVHLALEQDARQRGAARRLADLRERLARLTPREKEVMEAVTSGKRNKVIAADLGISQSMVETHRARVMEKMEARTVSDLMRMTLLADQPDP